MLEIIPIPSQHLVWCEGLGQDSSGGTVGCYERGIVPKLNIFADPGSERRETYIFRDVFDTWLQNHGMPGIVTVRYQPQNYKHWPPYYSLLENCLTNVTLPSLAYGYHTCSSKWKIAPINKYISSLPWARSTWAEGMKIRKAIGFDDSAHERRRAERGCKTFAIQDDEKDKYELWFPLQDWGWQRQDCIDALKRHGLPVPPKSSCFFCPAMKTYEVDGLESRELKVIVVIEARTRDRHLNVAKERGWPRGPGVPLCEGLWRRAVKGFRGATPRPGSMTEYIRQKGLLPSEEINRIIDATPTEPLSQADFERLGYNNWQEWLDCIIGTNTKRVADELLLAQLEAA